MSEVLNVIYSGSSCWEPLKGKELRGIQEECTGLILLPKQMLLFFFLFVFVISYKRTDNTTITRTLCRDTNVC